MTNIVPLKRPEGDDIPLAMRLIADALEAGEYSFKPTMAVLIFADEEASATESDLALSLHGLGVRCHSSIVVLGLLQAALANMVNGE